MIVVTALIELEHRFVGFKVMAYQQACLLELHQHAIHRRQAGVGAVFLQQLVDLLGGQMAHRALLEQLEDTQAWQGRFQTAGFQICGGIQRLLYRKGGGLGYDIRHCPAWKPCSQRAV